MCCCNNNNLGHYSRPMNFGCHNSPYYYDYTCYFTPNLNNYCGCCSGGGGGINSLCLIALYALLCR